MQIGTFVIFAALCKGPVTADRPNWHAGIDRSMRTFAFADFEEEKSDTETWFLADAR
jgi:hypothetical protein